jgi:hypothetical protein
MKLKKGLFVTKWQEMVGSRGGRKRRRDRNLPAWQSAQDARRGKCGCSHRPGKFSTAAGRARLCRAVIRCCSRRLGKLSTAAGRIYSPIHPKCSAARPTGRSDGGELADNFFSKSACNHNIWCYTARRSTKCGLLAVICCRTLSHGVGRDSVEPWLAVGGHLLPNAVSGSGSWPVVESVVIVRH